jgi:aspartyl-tRNA synthetase
MVAEEEEGEQQVEGGEKKKSSVGQELRLDHRVIDMRAPANLAIWKIESAVQYFFREFLFNQGFHEIHTPKLIATASEGGANVFEVNYFKSKAYLAQSPQLYKQMAVQGDLMRVFEIGPVFRAENSNTHRHLTEFVGLDLEMIIKYHYSEVLDLIDELFIHIFTGIETKYKKELEIISQQYDITPISYDKKKNLRITYAEGMKLLREVGGVNITDLEDISTTQEKLLGKIIKEKYGTDFYFMDKFPLSVRPFYTMPDPKDENLSNSYDFFLRGEEISSGAQRIHDSDLLLKRAKELKVDVSPIQAYVDCFKYGAYPHGGCGVGLERVVMLYLGIKNIRKTSMFPRDPKRITP